MEPETWSAVWGPTAPSLEDRRAEQGIFTGQKAEPVGMKFTLFLSGQEKRGKPLDLQRGQWESQIIKKEMVHSIPN